MVLYAVHIANAATAAESVSDARRTRAARYAKADDRDRCLCAGLALDACLRTIGLRERCVTVDTDAHGKPFLRDHPQWHFSLSHSGEWAVCALDTAPIGVDIEQVRAVDTARLAERCYGMPPAPDTATFFKQWTRQESFVKAVGVGLAGLGTAPTSEWRFRHYPLDGYWLTVCSQSDDFADGLRFL